MGAPMIATQIIPSGSTDGKAIKIVAVATPGTTLHQVANSVLTMDKVWIYIFNSDTVDRVVTIEFGGVASPDDTCVQTIPSKSGWYCVVPGRVLQNNLIIKAFADATNVLMAWLDVLRITV